MSYKLKCRRHQQTDCRRGCRRPRSGTRLTRNSDYAYYDSSGNLTDYMIDEVVTGPSSDGFCDGGSSSATSYDSGSSFSGGGDW